MGAKRCSHGKEKRSCVECSPCPHGKVKRHCVEFVGCPVRTRGGAWLGLNFFKWPGRAPGPNSFLCFFPYS